MFVIAWYYVNTMKPAYCFPNLNWGFWGEFGLRTAGPLSLKSKRTKFEGTYRWSLTGMLAEFDEWNRKWIAEPESQTDHLLSMDARI